MNCICFLGGSGSCIDGPVTSGKVFFITSGNLSSTLPIILFLSVLSNSGLCIYLTAMYAKTLIDETIKNEIIDKIFASLEKLMVKDAILKAISHTLIISCLLIIPTIAPMYLIMSYMTTKVHQKM